MIKSIVLNHDRNGNKKALISTGRMGGNFSIQTNGNLPRTHNMPGGYVGRAYFDTAVAEIIDYISRYGTDRQKKLIGAHK